MGNIAAFPVAQDGGTVLNVEAEQAVLGALLLNAEFVGHAVAAGGEDLFGDPVHAALFKRIAYMDHAQIHVSPVTMRGWAEAHEGLKEVGGAVYLVRLASFACSFRDLDHYIDLLADISGRRRMISAMDEARIAIGKGEEPAPVIAGRLEAALVDMGSIVSAPKPVSMTSAVATAMESALAAHNGEQGLCIATDIERLDHYIGGFWPGEMTLLGGRPSMGKTAIALTMALNMARAGFGGVIVSLEMNPEALAVRAVSEALSQRGNAIAYTDIRRGNFEERDGPHLRAAAEQVANLPIQFLSRTFSDLGALHGGVRQAKRILGERMSWLIVDYAQLLKAPGRDRYQQITEISMALKSLAGQMNIPVLALSQLNRQVEQREDKRPMLSDLRESGQLEQDADSVLFAYRDEYYLEREQPEPHDTEAMEGWTQAMQRARNRLEIIVAKNRQGPIGTAHLFCAPAHNRIWE